MPYNKVPNWYTGQMLKNTHVPVAYWRSVGGSQNCFYLESFIDELAHAAGKDPLEFRRSLTDRVDSLAVLNKLAEISGWGKPMAPGRGRGISLVDNHGAVGGQIAEVTVDANRRRCRWTASSPPPTPIMWSIPIWWMPRSKAA